MAAIRYRLHGTCSNAFPVDRPLSDGGFAVIVCHLKMLAILVAVRSNPRPLLSIIVRKSLRNNTDNKFMRVLKPALLLAAIVLFSGVASFAQENDVKVVDEVVAVVNDSVITLSSIKREVRERVDSLVKDGGMKREDAEKRVAEKQGELIANLINEELLLQKGKELGVEKDIEAELNARFLQIMKEQNLKTVDQLYEAMRKEGMDPEDIRDLWRKQATKEEVIRRDVQAKLYWTPNGTQVKEYFQTNKVKFLKPEAVTLSEIFLNFAGQTQDAVRAKAKQLVTQARGGADFSKLILENSESQDLQKTKGVLGTVPVSDLEKQFAKYATAIKGLKVGQVAEPIEDDLGVHILHVDARTAAETDAQFDEDAVRRAMLEVGYPDALKKYMVKLREDSYIKISDTYKPIVSPLLYADERATTTATKTTKN
jgi:peptidyl-prolyl cis-trans isomerase SurA